MFDLLIESGDVIIDHTEQPECGASGGREEAMSATVEGEEVVEILAHRVVVAAHCDWFRRALQSGMKEAINRQVFFFLLEVLS